MIRIRIKFHFLDWYITPSFDHGYRKAYESLSFLDNETKIQHRAFWFGAYFSFLFFTITVKPKSNH